MNSEGLVVDICVVTVKDLHLIVVLCELIAIINIILW